MSKMSTACDLCGQKKNWWRQGGGRPPGPPMPVSATGMFTARRIAHSMYSDGIRSYKGMNDPLCSLTDVYHLQGAEG